MRRIVALQVLALGFGLGLPGLLPRPVHGQWHADARAEGSLFANRAAVSRLPAPEASLVFHALGSVEWDAGRQWLDLEPFLRLDLVSGERTRLDLRQASWTIARGRWELLAGVTERYWGVVESRRVVDVINQWYSVGSVAGYEKLGQPMLRAVNRSDLGTFEVMLLPLFRERPFAGSAGHLWSPLPVDDDRVAYLSGSGGLRPDFAIRWSHSLGNIDLGLAHFGGTNRDPWFESRVDDADLPVLAPVYARTDRTSLDVQWTSGGWLWKAEAMTATAPESRYGAAAAGLEHAFADYLSAFVEYAYDSRGSEATTSYEHDVYVGGRLLHHEGSIEANLFVDTDSGNRIVGFGLRQRLTDRLTLDLEARGFMGDAQREPGFAPRQGSFLAVTLTAYY